MTFRRAFPIAAALLIAAVPSFAQTQQTQQQRKYSKEETAQFKTLHDQVDAVQNGKQQPSTDAKLTFRPYFMKAANLVYIPYTAHFDAPLSAYPVGMYVRAVSKNAPAQKPAEVKREPRVDGGDYDQAPTPKPQPTYAFEDVYFINSAPANPGEISRAMQLAPGDYTLYFAFNERPSKDKKAPPAKMVVFTQPLTVPDYSTGLSTSSVILAKSVDPAGAGQLTYEQQLEQPYTVAGYKITPAPTATFSKTGELLWVYYIYNEGAAAAGKPDLHVEYAFFRPTEDKPFVSMAPTDYNATTLPKEFDLAKGHMVFVAQGVPLTTFEPGDYKIQIKITDKSNNQSVTRDVPFSVTQ